MIFFQAFPECVSDPMHEPFFALEMADKWITRSGFRLFFHWSFESDIESSQESCSDVQAEISKASVSQLKGYQDFMSQISIPIQGLTQIHCYADAANRLFLTPILCS